ncbi:MAG: DUF6503 family protein [Bacteroidota bacterium]
MHYPPLFLASLFLVLCFACQSNPDPKEIIAQAIEAHGGDNYDSTHISFSFRDRHYDIHLAGGQFTYERSWEDSLGTIHDMLNNQEFIRKIDQEVVDLSAEDEQRYANSLNSVVYFALLPQPLADPAVNATYLGTDMLKSEIYHKIKVTFDQEGGGTDFDDVFVYWFHQDKHTMDYLAYEFHVNDGGTRFREAYNVREAGGIRFSDYINYTDTLHSFALEKYDTQFAQEEVQELSRIDLENLEVELAE